MFVIWGCIRIKGEEVLHKKDLSPTVVFQLTVPRLFLWCSSSLFLSHNKFSDKMAYANLIDPGHMAPSGAV